MTKAWSCFDAEIELAKETCYNNLVGLLDSISEDLARQWRAHGVQTLPYGHANLGDRRGRPIFGAYGTLHQVSCAQESSFAEMSRRFLKED